MSSLPAYEKLGAFYLGRRYDVAAGRSTNEPLLYDSRDLCTHALCVGMTGSGKTGLCIALLEEAAIDGVPALVIDPKGDMGNLLLTFPSLAGADFRPWIDETIAQRQGQSPDDYAASQAEAWRNGLAEWEQDAARVARLRESVDLAIYTPGSSAGLPLTVLRSFDAPAKEVLDDADVYRQRVASAASGLLALLGVDADPVQSREHILLSNVLDHAWRAGLSLTLPEIIRRIQAPPFDRLGVLDLESFFPEKDRAALAMTMNNLLASPSFASWLEGEPLDVKRLLHTPEGKPRISILSIAHLSDAERMFFVTIVLTEVLAWMRSQSGTSALRALLYMDEVFGFFPPVANPPSKPPMLTLLKQARAFGLGVVLATQNPVDLDYKGLSNIGTWFLGRLQTERDKARVLEGLEGASQAAGQAFDRSSMDVLLSGLAKRVFLMNNVHEDAPLVFQSRWALSYLRGPLTREQIKRLMYGKRTSEMPTVGRVCDPSVPPGTTPSAGDAHDSPTTPAPSSTNDALTFDDLAPLTTSPPTSESAPSSTPALPHSHIPALPAFTAERILLPPGIPQRFVALRRALAAGDQLLYRPALCGRAKLHFVRATYHLDLWSERTILSPLPTQLPADVWEGAKNVETAEQDFAEQPAAGAQFAAPPAAAANEKSYARWQARLKDYLYRTQQLVIWKCAELKELSEPDEPEMDFRLRLDQQLRELRDEAVDKLRAKFADKVAAQQERVRKARERIGREQAQHQQKQVESAVSIGATIFGAILGRKVASKTTVDKAATSARGVGRAAKERGDVDAAQRDCEAAKAKLAALEAQLQTEIEKLAARLRPEALTLERLTVPPRKADIGVLEVSLVWTPWAIDGATAPRPLA